MNTIKTKDIKLKTIKILNKSVLWTNRVKNETIKVGNKFKKEEKKYVNVNDYGTEKLKQTFKNVKYSNKMILNKIKNQRKRKNVVKSSSPNHIVKPTLKEKNSINKKIQKQGKNLAINSYKKSIKKVKQTPKKIISSIRGIIKGVKLLVAAIIASLSASIIVIVIICFIGLLVASPFGIFFSNEKTSKRSITINDVIDECNKEFNDKIELFKKQNIHDEYVLNGNLASWKDILLIYTIKTTLGITKEEVLTINETKKELIKQIFWDMNEITLEVKTDSGKRVLYINIKNKSLEDMKTKYNFNSSQIKILNELSNPKYDNLWNNNQISASNVTGDFINWRQMDPKWANIRVGSSSKTLGRIGCLITSISILIEKSGCNKTINPFNPGTFLQSLNRSRAFDGSGNLSFHKISSVVPSFQYVGNVNLRGKSKIEKYATIKEYLNLGYHITAEVKGATPGNQHWVAVIDAKNNNIIMVDPASDSTMMWSKYDYNRTSQFSYFKTT